MQGPFFNKHLILWLKNGTIIKTAEGRKSMMQGISTDRVLSRLDEYLNKNDYASAQRHLLYWLDEAQGIDDSKAQLLILSELIGLYRKLGKKEQTLEVVEKSMRKISELGIENQVGSATIYLNCATAYKAFGMAEKSIPVFEKALKIYQNELDKSDRRFGGLYNNFALALVDIKDFDRAYELYNRAVSVMQQAENGSLEVAITYLNIASAKEAELGLEMAEKEIEACLERARALLEGYEKRDGYYAFVCEKCASVFGYYGHFAYENELNERARRIYEGA